MTTRQGPTPEGEALLRIERILVGLLVAVVDVLPHVADEDARAELREALLDAKAQAVAARDVMDADAAAGGGTGG